MPKQHLPSLCVPALGEQDLPVSPGSGHSGKNHEHQQLPEVHHHVYEIKKWDFFQWCWWAPAHMPKYYVLLLLFPERRQTLCYQYIYVFVLENIYDFVLEHKSHWAAKNAIKQLWSNSPVSTPKLASGNHGCMTFQGLLCTFKAHSGFLFHKLVQFSVFLLRYSLKGKSFNGLIF